MRALMEHQQSHEAGGDRASRLCLSGPHKDDLEVLVNGRSARQFCSQGQVRTAALGDEAGRPGDTQKHHRGVSHDAARRRAQRVGSPAAGIRTESHHGGQVFITCCENDRLDTLLSGRVFHVRGGEVL